MGETGDRHEKYPDMMSAGHAERWNPSAHLKPLSSKRRYADTVTSSDLLPALVLTRPHLKRFSCAAGGWGKAASTKGAKPAGTQRIPGPSQRAGSHVPGVPRRRGAFHWDGPSRAAV